MWIFFHVRTFLRKKFNERIKATTFFPITFFSPKKSGNHFPHPLWFFRIAYICKAMHFIKKHQIRPKNRIYSIQTYVICDYLSYLPYNPIEDVLPLFPHNHLNNEPVRLRSRLILSLHHSFTADVLVILGHDTTKRGFELVNVCVLLACMQYEPLKKCDFGWCRSLLYIWWFIASILSVTS